MVMDSVYCTSWLTNNHQGNSGHRPNRRYFPCRLPRPFRSSIVVYRSIMADTLPQRARYGYFNSSLATTQFLVYLLRVSRARPHTWLPAVWVVKTTMDIVLVEARRLVRNPQIHDSCVTHLKLRKKQTNETVLRNSF